MLVDLTTDFLELRLNNPIVASSSPLTWNVDSALALEDAGVAAIIMPSLFEEQIEQEQENLQRQLQRQAMEPADMADTGLDLASYEAYQDIYFKRLQQLKSELKIPVIASLNGTSAGGWVLYAKQMEQAGADALELNVYYVAANPDETSSQIEQRYFDVLQSVRQQVSIPICLKLSHQFTALIPLVKQMQQLGAAGVSLFNRFYQPDIDLDAMNVVPRLDLSHSREALLRIRWIAMLYQQVDLSLAITGGIHNEQDVLTSLLAGSDVCCMCSALLENGSEQVTRVLHGLQDWMQQHDYSSVRQLQGKLSYLHAANAADYERANYQEVLENYIQQFEQNMREP
ncbi:MAG: dihydroorotate dehydrogenase-like protein [Gammaproteobacteria bacterium]|nr:dihydroorotate dehydrogenase-like protein [Gammaproteobacteria bacterium]